MENYRMTSGDLEQDIANQTLQIRSIFGSLLDKIEDLEKRNDELDLIIEFHKLKIPLKYRKSGLIGGDRSLFKARENFKKDAFPIVGNLSQGHFEQNEIPMPKDSKEYTKAKERMMEYAKQQNMVNQVYYEVYDYSSNNLMLLSTIDKSLAEICVEEGGLHYSTIPELKDMPGSPNRFMVTRYRKVMPES